LATSPEWNRFVYYGIKHYDAAVLVKETKISIASATLAYSLILQMKLQEENKEIRARSSPMI
jgi:hypothetical protein